MRFILSILILAGYINPWGLEKWGVPRHGVPQWGTIEVVDEEGAFVSTWNTSNAGVSNDDQIKLPLIDVGTFDMWVYWGDGTYDHITAFDDAAITHTYPAAGEYTIRITGTMGGWQFDDGGDKLKILDISEWGVFDIQNDCAFEGCANMDVSANDAPSISSTLAMRSLFRNCSNVTRIGDVAAWPTENCTDWYACFTRCNITQDLSALKITAAATSLRYTFSHSNYNMNFPFDNYDTQNVANMDHMLYNCDAFDQNLGVLNIESVTNAAGFMEDTPGLSPKNYDSTLISFADQDVNNNLSWDFGGSTFNGGEVATGTTDADAADKLIDNDGPDFVVFVTVGDVVFNVTDNTYALVTNVDSETQLSVAPDIMDITEDYAILTTDAAKAKAHLIIEHSWTISDGGY